MINRMRLHCGSAGRMLMLVGCLGLDQAGGTIDMVRGGQSLDFDDGTEETSNH